MEIPLHPTFTSTERIRVSLHTLEALSVNPDRAVGAYMADNSMIDIIQQGATLAIDSGRTQIVDGEIYAVEHDGMLRIKYLYNRPGGGKANVHIKVLYGRSNHHKIEASFKAFARALRGACSRDERMADLLPSTKGLL